MKKKSIKGLVTIGLIFSMQTLLAQGPPPPPGDPTVGGPVGGSAALGSGVGMLLLMGAAYGGKKVYKFWKERQEMEE
jgi:hypothetical protein